MCRLADDLVCLGSRLGDSLIIKFSRKQDTTKSILSDESESVERPEKRLKLSQQDSLFEKEEKSEMDFLEEGECIALILTQDKWNFDMK